MAEKVLPITSERSLISADRLREQYQDGTNLNARFRLHRRFSTNRYGLFRWIFDRFDLPPRARILELGSGTAMLWRSNADRIPAGWRTILSDLSAGMIRDGRSNLAGFRNSLMFAQLDAQSLPFSDRVFDAVIANHTLYHVPEIPTALCEIRRVLLPSGKLFAAAFGRANMKEFDDALVRLISPGAASSSATRFGLETGRDLMSEVFCSVEIVKYPDSLVVTEVQPLMDYVESIGLRSAQSDRKAALRNFFEAELNRNGAIHITKDTGLLIGSA
jgi:ubiquinone/menaquinone biosynthesis C-methylase UbiE